MWVLYDADKNKVPMDRKKPYSAGNGAAAWFIGCLLLWIVFFLCYLVVRSRVIAERLALPPTATITPPPPAGVALHCWKCGTPLAAGSGFCHVCGSPAHSETS
jgi:hypothetical protein